MEAEEPISIAHSLDAVMRSVRGPSRNVVGGVFGRWDEIVGPNVAAHVRPVQLDESILLVQVDDPAWATQMKFLAPQIIAQIHDAVGVTIQRIDVKVEAASARGQRDYDGRSRSRR